MVVYEECETGIMQYKRCVGCPHSYIKYAEGDLPVAKLIIHCNILQTKLTIKGCPRNE